MLSLSLPSLRQSDLTHTTSAVLAAAERILASCRLPPGRLSPIPCGALLLDQTGAPRKWRPQPAEALTRCHLVNRFLYDLSFGVYALLNQRTGTIESDQYVVIAPWHSCQQGAEYLRSECLGERLYTTFLPEVLDNHLNRISAALELPERAPNDQRAGYSRIRHGAMLRFDEKSTQAASDYFILDESAPPGEILSVKLGAGCELSYCLSAQPGDPMRAIVSDNSWSTQMAGKELRRWLKSLGRARAS